MRFYKERRDIMRDDKSIYLRRWYILDTPWFGLKLHKILLSDHDCVHDHPWDFISLILKGGYVEHTEIPKPSFVGATHFKDDGVEGEYVKKVSKIYHPGQILFRKAEHRHKLEIHQPCWTFVITLKRRRKWGFWTKLGFVHWKLLQSTQSCD
jgi:hypothetical protein